MGGRPVRTSGQPMIASTSTPATNASAISVRVARRLPLTTPTPAACDLKNATRLEHVEEKRALVGRRGEIEERIGGRGVQVRHRLRAGDPSEAFVRRRMPWADSNRKTHDIRDRLKPLAILSVNADGDTSSVATRSRVTRIRCAFGDVTPESSREAMPSDRSRVVSEALSGSNHRRR